MGAVFADAGSGPAVITAGATEARHGPRATHPSDLGVVLVGEELRGPKLRMIREVARPPHLASWDAPSPQPGQRALGSQCGGGGAFAPQDPGRERSSDNNGEVHYLDALRRQHPDPPAQSHCVQ